MGDGRKPIPEQEIDGPHCFQLSGGRVSSSYSASTLFQIAGFRNKGPQPTCYTQQVRAIPQLRNRGHTQVEGQLVCNFGGSKSEVES